MEFIQNPAIRVAGTIYEGKNFHSDAYEAAVRSGKLTNSQALDLIINQTGEQGFLTNTGRFVNREEAARIAVEAGQASRGTTSLISEGYRRIDSIEKRGSPVPKKGKKSQAKRNLAKVTGKKPGVAGDPMTRLVQVATGGKIPTGTTLSKLAAEEYTLDQLTKMLGGDSVKVKGLINSGKLVESRPGLYQMKLPGATAPAPAAKPTYQLFSKAPTVKPVGGIFGTPPQPENVYTQPGLSSYGQQAPAESPPPAPPAKTNRLNIDMTEEEYLRKTPAERRELAGQGPRSKTASKQKPSSLYKGGKMADQFSKGAAIKQRAKAAIKAGGRASRPAALRALSTVGKVGRIGAGIGGVAGGLAILLPLLDMIYSAATEDARADATRNQLLESLAEKEGQILEEEQIARIGKTREAGARFLEAQQMVEGARQDIELSGLLQGREQDLAMLSYREPMKFSDFVRSGV